MTLFKTNMAGLPLEKIGACHCSCARCSHQSVGLNKILVMHVSRLHIDIDQLEDESTPQFTLVQTPECISSLSCLPSLFKIPPLKVDAFLFGSSLNELHLSIYTQVNRKQSVFEATYPLNGAHAPPPIFNHKLKALPAAVSQTPPSQNSLLRSYHAILQSMHWSIFTLKTQKFEGGF